MTTYSATRQRNLDIALLVLRLVLAAVFISHGYQKVFGYGFAGVTNSFTQMGVPLPAVTAPIISVLELAGGVALLFGAFSRIAGFLLACDMLGAMLLVHAKNGFSSPKGIESVLPNFTMALVIALVGAGAYSVDAMLSRRGAGTTSSAS
ncbi:MAG: DoxX family protein [Gemmatimonadota bacterium]